MRTEQEQEQYIDRLKIRLSKDYKVVIEPYIKCDGEYNWFFNWEIGPTSTPSSSMFAGMAMPTMAKTNANTKIT